MTDPSRTVVPDGGPRGNGGLDARIVTIGVLVAVIVLMVIVLLVVRVNDDDGGLTTDAPSTTLGASSTTETTGSTSSSTITSSTTSEPVTTTTQLQTSTTAATTTTTTTPPVTIAPTRCRGTAAPNDPDTVAVVFYDAWRVDDRACAEEFATEEAISTLFQLDGSDAAWVAQGCESHDDVSDPRTDCAYTYEGGAAFFEMRFGAIGGWQIFGVRFVAD